MNVLGKLRSMSNLVTIIGCILCVAIIFSGTDAMYVMIVLGALNLYMGICNIMNKNALLQSKCQILIGGYIFIMGILYVLAFIPTGIYWKLFFIGLMCLIGYAFFAGRRAKAR